MVEISNARFAELISAETTLKAVKRAFKTLPSYMREDTFKVLLNDESEVKKDAE